LDELQEIPDTIGRMTALELLTLGRCRKLRTLPASIMHLSRLQKLSISDVLLEDMPCFEALTALLELRLDVADYAHDSRAFTALSRWLPCLQQLQVLGLRASDVDDNGDDFNVALRARDVLAIGRALKAWPLPLLHVFDVEQEKPSLGQLGALTRPTLALLDGLEEMPDAVVKPTSLDS
jgi:hypothetical protein